MALPLMTQTQLVDRLSQATGYSKSEIRVVMIALDDEVTSAVNDCRRVKVAGVTIEPALKKASKKRMGRNPQTGEEVEISAKPASTRVKARVSRALQDSAPSVVKLKKRLAAV
jgi:nucleoid DNA-binding protein